MKTTENKSTQPRERSTGRYGYDNRFERICARCGYRLGVHTAEAPHTIDDDVDAQGRLGNGGTHVECSGFRPSKVT